MVDTKLIRAEVSGLMSDTRIWSLKKTTDYTKVSKEQYIIDMQTKYNYLYMNSTTLFERCLAGVINMQQFEFMLSMLEKVNAGNDYQTVSQQVGQQLVDIYVKPLIETNDNK